MPATLAAFLRQNYPNPFNPTTEIEFSLADRGRSTSLCSTVAGRRVATLHQGELAAGSHRVAWHGLTDAGLPAPSGQYRYTLTTESAQLSRSMRLLK